MKTGNEIFDKYTLENDVSNDRILIRKWTEVELKDDQGTWWETKTPVIESVSYPHKSDKYFETKKELEKKYSI